MSLERWLPDGVDAIDRSCFKKSRLYISYNEHVCQLLLDKGKELFHSNNTQKGLSFLSDALSAASCDNVPPGFRQTAELGIKVFGDYFKTDIDRLDFLLPNEEESVKNTAFLMNWAPNMDTLRLPNSCCQMPN